MSINVIHTEAAPRAVGPYSQAIVADPFVFTAGQVGIVPATGELAGTEVGEQAEQVFRNLTAVLQAAGCALHHVVKTTCFLTTMDDFAAVNAVYEKYFGTHKPARSCVAVHQLPRGARVEIEAVAVKQ